MEMDSRGICRDVGFKSFKCSRCGAELDLTDESGESTLSVGGIAAYPSYCPVCGGRVMLFPTADPEAVDGLGL